MIEEIREYKALFAVLDLLEIHSLHKTKYNTDEPISYLVSLFIVSDLFAVMAAFWEKLAEP